MTRRAFIAAALVGLCSLLSGAATTNLAQLARTFKAPPQEYGVNCWWWWLNGHVDAEGLRADLRAMKAKGFQGAMVFDAGGHNQRGNANIPAGPLFGSPAWCELLAAALDEAEKLGLEIGFNIQSGWNLGGPRVTPAHAAKCLTYSSVVVKRGMSAPAVLPQPRADKRFYKDVAILAFPIDPAKMSTPIKALDSKLAVKEMGMSAADWRFLLGNKGGGLRNKEQAKMSYLVPRASVLNLTGKWSADWRPPTEGDWLVMRLGCTLTGARVSTCSAGWEGLVLDYMSRAAFEAYWDDVVEPIFKRVRPHVGKTLKFMETDSWECGGMNWTDGFAAAFERLHGYDPLPFLPVLAGVVIDDLDTTHAFLADFRKTIAELVAVNHYTMFAEKAHAYNMGIQPESAGPHAGPLDGIRNYSVSDIVMSEFWAESPHRPTPEARFFVKQAASAAHIYGKRIVGAESFTTIGPHWNDQIGVNQKQAFDHEVCSGLNRAYFHTFSASPASMGLPEQEYFAGTHMNPRLTWWNEADGYIDYMRRVQSVVQNGRFVADALYYYGDHVPNIYPLKERDMPGVLPDYDYDVVDERALLQLSVTADGCVRAPSGLTYRILVLPNHDVLSPRAMAQLDQLLEKGATVVGTSPTAPRAITRDPGPRKMNWAHKNLHAGKRGAEVLKALGVAPDFTVERAPRAAFDYIHYTIGGDDVYFISNQSRVQQTVTCGFRTARGRPELWDPLDGSIRALPVFTRADGRTQIPLQFDPVQSYFIVFRADAKPATASTNFPVLRPLRELGGSWRVTFDPAWDGPKEVVFDDLDCWTERDDVRYYSGAGVYHKSFWMDPFVKAHRTFLELGLVLDVGIAVVTLNGKTLPVSWTLPFRVEITDAVRPGQNELAIKVVNSWYNRVLGEQLGEVPVKRTQTNIRLAKTNGMGELYAPNVPEPFMPRPKIDSNQGIIFFTRAPWSYPRSPSGLMGPVRLLTDAPK